MASRRISVRIQPEVERRLRREAAVNGCSESVVVRAALEAYFQREGAPETAHDAARRAGVIGCIGEAPADLSTNRRHFEGFGRR
jgi:predicted transcriptional regulator